MLILPDFLRSRKLQKIFSDLLLAILICCFTLIFLVNKITLTSSELGEKKLRNNFYEMKEIDEKKLIIFKIDYKNILIKHTINLNTYDYNSCSYYSFHNKFEDQNQISLLKNETIFNLKEYFNIDNLKPFDKLCDVTFTVKTTKTNHDSKLPVILNTWMSEVSSKVCLFY